MRSPYQWIIDRARAGEPVPIDTTRRDMGKIIDFLMVVCGHGITIQCDNTVDIMWIVRSDACETTSGPARAADAACRGVA